MNKYRLVRSDYDYDEYSCLNCHNSFCIVGGRDYKYCPHCGTMWDGIFNIHHKRYQLKSDYDYKNPGYKTSPDTNEFIQSDKPRLIIEYGEVINKKLSGFGFFTEQTIPVWRWSLCCHTTIGSFIQGKSSFAYMYNDYVKKSKQYKNLRLRLLNGIDNKIIKSQINGKSIK